MTSELAGLRSDVTSELAGLQSNMTSELAGLWSDVESQLATIENITSDLHNSLQSNTQQLAQLCAKMDTLYSKLISQCTPVPLSSTPTPHTTPTSRPSSPTSLPPSPTSLPPSSTSLPPSPTSLSSSPTSLPPSPTSLPPSPTSLPSSPTSLPPSPTSLPPSPTSLPLSPTSLPPSPTCTSLPPSPTLLQSSPTSLPCGGTGGWRRVVYLNFTDPNTTCPSGWGLTNHSKRACGRVNESQYVYCDSVTFPVSGGDYTRVCGRIIGSQFWDPYAFGPYHYDVYSTTIDDHYVTGVSLTHGSPRQHIWTFAVGNSETNPTSNEVCPCDATINIIIPPFVGGDYFCESGWNAYHYPGHTLWDGDGCGANSTCCSFNNPPYFTKQLTCPTTDDIEARICHYEVYEDASIQLIELYVQ